MPSNPTPRHMPGETVVVTNNEVSAGGKQTNKPVNTEFYTLHNKCFKNDDEIKIILLK